MQDLHTLDANISRNARAELRRDDWSALVLHFPGLDHVGHMGGADSAFMAPKQAQMDGMIREIYENLEKEAHLSSTLLVVGGDHGMNQLGGHGGGSDPEISAAMMFISPHMKSLNQGIASPIAPSGGSFDYYTVIKQVDLVPTLAGLMGVSIPSDSIGVFIPEVLSLWTDAKDRLRIIADNIEHLRGLSCRNGIANGATCGPDRDWGNASRGAAEQESLENQFQVKITPIKLNRRYQTKQMLWMCICRLAKASRRRLRTPRLETFKSLFFFPASSLGCSRLSSPIFLVIHCAHPSGTSW